MANRGVTAGSGLATSELRVLLIGLMDELQQRWTLVLVVKLYVDDLTLAACGLPRQVIALMAQAIDFVVNWLENRLGMQVSEMKSKVDAGRDCIAAAIVQATTTTKVSATTHLKLLGTDSVGGGHRSTLTFRG